VVNKSAHIRIGTELAVVTGFDNPHLDDENLRRRIEAAITAKQQHTRTMQHPSSRRPPQAHLPRHSIPKRASRSVGIDHRHDIRGRVSSKCHRGRPSRSTVPRAYQCANRRGYVQLLNGWRTHLARLFWQGESRHDFITVT
jgi:hypothetical protein